MGLRFQWKSSWKHGVLAGTAVGLAGWLLLGLGRGDHEADDVWSRLSYDLTFAFRPRYAVEDLIIVGMDEKSYRELELGWEDLWPRRLHASLLDKLTEDRASTVVFDVWFSDPGDPAENKLLADAMRRHGQVVLAAISAPMASPGLAGESVLLPRREFLEAAVGWGISEIYTGPDSVSRKLYAGTEIDPSLAWTAAEAHGAAVAQDRGQRLRTRWLNYYGPAGVLPEISYVDALERPEGFFEDKLVLVGARRQTGRTGEENDEFPTPYTRLGGDFAGGVEVIATTVLNLVREDWLTRWPRWGEAGMIVLFGVAAGWFISRWRPWTGLAWTLGLMALGIAASGTVVWTTNTWFCWLIPVAVQLPLAWVGGLVIHLTRAEEQSRFLQHTLDETIGEIKRATALEAPTDRGEASPWIPDHELLRRVGRGAYGEVWLARNTIGMYHAVKIVHRDSFSHEGPYEREFRGIQKYMPVSRSHPGLVNILHVGRNDRGGYFYYIMETADDEVTGTTIDPESYRPRSLASVLGQKKLLSAGACVPLMVTLTAALEQLHRQKLVHRDIKPSNIIYLDGIPKFADIGLVTDLASREQQVTMVGTRGYIPPEGPGTAAADVYSLGKVLYVAATGMDAEMFPELPTDFCDRTDFGQFKELNAILGRACDSDPERRYRSAGEMHAALLRLQFQWGQRPAG